MSAHRTTTRTGTTILTLALAVPVHAWMVTRPAAPGLLGAFAEDVLIDAAGDVVVAGDGTNVEPPTAGAVTKLAGSDGTPIWTTGITLNAPRLLLHPSGDVLLVAVENVTVSLTVGFARLDGATGMQEWYEEISLPVSGLEEFEPAPPVLTPDGNLLTAVNPGRIGAPSTVMIVDSADGSLVWSQDLANWFDPVVAVDASGDVLVGGWNVVSGDTLAARLASADGTPIWTRTIASSAAPIIFDRRQSAVVGHPDGDAVVANGTVDGGSSAVFKLAAADGSDVWRFDAAEGRRAGLLVESGGDVMARLGLINTRVVRLNAASGTAVWSVVPALQTIHLALRPDNDLLALGAEGTVLQSIILVQRLAMATGATVSRLPPSGGYFGSNAVGAATDGAVALTGLWDLPGPGSIGSFAQLVATRAAGRRLVVRQDAVTPQRNRLVLTSKDKRLMVPIPGSGPEDPTSGGGEIVLENPDTAESVSFVLPAGNWVAKAIDPEGNGTTYRYADSSGACPRVLVRSGRIKMKCVGPLMNYTLDVPQQGALRVTLRLGTAPDYCFEFGGTVIRDEGAVTGGVFKAKDAGAPVDCPGGI